MVKINSFRSGFSSLERREFSAREDAKCSSFFVRENKKKETGHRPLRGHEFARYCELRIFYREIFSRIGWLAASRRNRPSEHFSFHRSPPLPSPPHPATAIHLSVLPFFVPSFLSFLPFFQPSPLPPNKNRIKMRDLLKRLILRVGQPSHAMPRMSFWTQWRERRKENSSLVTRSSANSRSYLDDAKRIASPPPPIIRDIYIYFILKQTLKANDFVFDLNELLLLLLLFFDCI